MVVGCWRLKTLFHSRAARVNGLKSTLDDGSALPSIWRGSGGSGSSVDGGGSSSSSGGGGWFGGGDGRSVGVGCSHGDRVEREVPFL